MPVVLLLDRAVGREVDDDGRNEVKREGKHVTADLDDALMIAGALSGEDEASE